MQSILQALRARNDREEGFTLIELMVVVLIIAILIAIAIPTFLGAQNKAKDRAAQSSLRNALTAAKTAYTDNQDYTQETSSALAAVEPSLQFVVTGTASTGPNNISVNPSSTTTLYLAAWSKSGTCFGIRDVIASVNGGTSYAKLGTAQASCTGTAAAGGTYTASW